jgi:hypothetical protein
MTYIPGYVIPFPDNPTGTSAPYMSSDDVYNVLITVVHVCEHGLRDAMDAGKFRVPPDIGIDVLVETSESESDSRWGKCEKEIARLFPESVTAVEVAKKVAKVCTRIWIFLIASEPSFNPIVFLYRKRNQLRTKIEC